MNRKTEEAKCFNPVFSNIIKNLNKSIYMVEDTLHRNLNHYPTLKAISKYRVYPSIQGLIQNLKLGDNMNVSSRWSITDTKKCVRQIGLLCSVLYLV